MHGFPVGWFTHVVTTGNAEVVMNAVGVATATQAPCEQTPPLGERPVELQEMPSAWLEVDAHSPFLQTADKEQESATWQLVWSGSPEQSRGRVARDDAVVATCCSHAPLRHTPAAPAVVEHAVPFGWYDAAVPADKQLPKRHCPTMQGARWHGVKLGMPMQLDDRVGACVTGKEVAGVDAGGIAVFERAMQLLCEQVPGAPVPVEHKAPAGNEFPATHVFWIQSP